VPLCNWPKRNLQLSGSHQRKDSLGAASSTGMETGRKYGHPRPARQNPGGQRRRHSGKGLAGFIIGKYVRPSARRCLHFLQRLAGTPRSKANRALIRRTSGGDRHRTGSRRISWHVAAHGGNGLLKCRDSLRVALKDCLGRCGLALLSEQRKGQKGCKNERRNRPGAHAVLPQTARFNKTRGPSFAVRHVNRPNAPRYNRYVKKRIDTLTPLRVSRLF